MSREGFSLPRDLPELDAVVSKYIDLNRSIRNSLAVRERELLTLKGPCVNAPCILHFEHLGSCKPGNYAEFNGFNDGEEG